MDYSYLLVNVSLEYWLTIALYRTAMVVVASFLYGTSVVLEGGRERSWSLLTLCFLGFVMGRRVLIDLGHWRPLKVAGTPNMYHLKRWGPVCPSPSFWLRPLGSKSSLATLKKLHYKSCLSVCSLREKYWKWFSKLPDRTTGTSWNFLKNLFIT